MVGEADAVEAFVGLGANLGDREAAIRRALDLLAASPGISGLRPSPIYESAPIGYVAQPPFLNAVVAVMTRLGTLQLFLALQRIESQIGRTRTFRWGPREIDLDLLPFGNVSIRRRGLVVPHPAMYQRAFVLVPLRDLSPTHHGPEGRPIDDILSSLDSRSEVVRRSP